MAPMIFKNFGGILQYVILNEADLASIDRLDEALWAATSAPHRDFHCDPVVFTYLDPDRTGRIRVAQIVGGRDWLFSVLAKRDHVSLKSETLFLDDLSTSEDGAKLRGAATHTLTKLEAPDATALTLEQLRAFRDSVAKRLENGDGIVPPDPVPNAEVSAFIKDALSVVGGPLDASGVPGVGDEQVTRYVDGARAYAAWKTAGEKSKVQPFGPRTAALADVVLGLDAKMKEYFLHCDLLLQTQRQADAVRLPDEAVRAISALPGDAIERHLAEAPLSQPTPKGRLTFDASVNGYYAHRLGVVRDEVLPKVFDPDMRSITEDDWEKVKATFQPYLEWQAQKPPEPFDTLSPDRLEVAMEGSLGERTRAFIARDKAAAPEIAQLALLEKAILLQRWLIDITNNFVSFSALYDPSQHTLLRDGTLVIDGRRLEIAVRVEDRANHRKLAAESAIFLIYATISDGEGKTPAYDIVTPVTSGERGRIRIGKRGLYINRDGRQLDAIVVDIVENAISIPEAIRSPFRRIAAFVSKRIESLAGSQLESKLASTESHAAQTVTTPPPAAPAPSSSGMQNMLIGGGIVFAALGSTVAFLVSAFSKVRPLGAVEGIAGVCLFIAALAAFLGWLKLRKRDLALVLEASGWALNVRMKITRRLGRVFTRVPPLPPEAVIHRTDMLSLPPGAKTDEPSA